MPGLLFGIVLLAQTASVEPGPPCACFLEAKNVDVVFRGTVIDAELALDAGGDSARSRQATIFRLTRTLQGSVPNRIKVWHGTDPQSCGVRFDYGHVYTIRARRTEQGLETDACLLAGADDDLTK